MGTGSLGFNQTGISCEGSSQIQNWGEKKQQNKNGQTVLVPEEICNRRMHSGHLSFQMVDEAAKVNTTIPHSKSVVDFIQNRNAFWDRGANSHGMIF